MKWNNYKSLLEPKVWSEEGAVAQTEDVDSWAKEGRKTLLSQKLFIIKCYALSLPSAEAIHNRKWNISTKTAVLLSTFPQRFAKISYYIFTERWSNKS